MQQGLTGAHIPLTQLTGCAICTYAHLTAHESVKFLFQHNSCRLNIEVAGVWHILPQSVVDERGMTEELPETVFDDTLR